MKRNLFEDIGTLSNLIQLSKFSALELEEISQHKDSYYKKFILESKNGKKRKITYAFGELRIFQSVIKKYFDKKIIWPQFLHGGIKQRSIITNANPHLGKAILMNIDIENYFPSIRKSKIKDSLISFGMGEPPAELIADLSSLEDCLPQGVTTSCHFANLVLLNFDWWIYKVCNKHNLVYTRFIDDISISGDADLTRFKGSIFQRLKSEGFKVAENKFKISGKDSRKVVTGLVVNDKLRPTREFITSLKMDIRKCYENNGLCSLADYYGYSAQQLKTNLNGRLGFLRSIDEKKAKDLTRLMYGIDWKCVQNS